MSSLAVDDSRFAPAAFFARAALRLDNQPKAGRVGSSGDDHLNPGFLDDGADYRDAAVLVPIVAREPQATVILTKRTPHLSAHAGQIAFPGGKIDAEDAGPAAAAIREAGEEIGLDAAAIEPVGYLDPYLTRTRYRIVPVVARIDPDHRLAINPREVESAFEVPLEFLMNPANHHQGSREFFGKRRYFYEMPFGERYIWGITAGIIRGLYERVFGLMVRFVAFNAIFFLLPFAGFAVWLLATRGSAANVADWPVRAIAWLAVGGVLLVVVSLLFFIHFQGAPPGGKYVPATIEDGKIVPGHFD